MVYPVRIPFRMPRATTAGQTFRIEVFYDSASYPAPMLISII
jgi:hypothetical protein